MPTHHKVMSKTEQEEEEEEGTEGQSPTNVLQMNLWKERDPEYFKKCHVFNQIHLNIKILI